MKKNIIIILLLAAFITLNCVYAVEESNNTTATQENTAEQATVFEQNPDAAATLNDTQSALTDLQHDENKQNQLEIINQIQESIKVGAPIDLNASSGHIVEGSVEKMQIMSIEDCIRLALLNNPAIQAAISTKEIAKTQIGQAWSNYFPTLNLGATYSYNKQMMLNFKVPKDTYNLWNMPSVGFEQLIYDFGKTRAVTNIAKKKFESSDNSLQSTVNDTIFNVKEAYYNLLFAIQQEQVYADTVSNYEIHLEQAKAYYSIGTKAKIDVITAEYNLGNSKLNQIKAKHGIDIAYAKLNNAMGLPEHLNYSVDENFDLPFYDIKFDKLLDIAYSQRPELLVAKNKMEASKILISASKFAFMPDLKAYGNYASGGVDPTNTYSYQIGGGLQYQTTNLYKLKKQVDEARATYKRDGAEYEQAKQMAYLQVKSAYIEYNTAKDSIPVAKLALFNAKEQHDLASGRYKTGLGDAIEMKDAEITYLNAQLEYYNTLLNYNVAVSNLEKVVGINLDKISTLQKPAAI